MMESRKLKTDVTALEKQIGTDTSFLRIYAIWILSSDPDPVLDSGSFPVN
jgi:hypothetical protein